MTKYSINIDYPTEKQEKLKAIVRVVGGSVRQFIAEAIDNEIDYRLKKMSKSEREVAEILINQGTTSGKK